MWSTTWCQEWDSLGGNIVENFKNFEVRFDDYCIQTNYRDITKVRTELLKIHLKPNNTLKTMQDVVAEAKAIESAQKTNKIIGEAKKGLETKGLEEQVNWTSHRDMKLKRDPGTCHWCGNQRGPHPWKSCPANGKTGAKCGGNDHFAKVCLEEPLHRPGGEARMSKSIKEIKPKI